MCTLYYYLSLNCNWNLLSDWIFLDQPRTNNESCLNCKYLWGHMAPECEYGFNWTGCEVVGLRIGSKYIGDYWITVSNPVSKNCFYHGSDRLFFEKEKVKRTSLNLWKPLVELFINNLIIILPKWIQKAV